MNPIWTFFFTQSCGTKCYQPGYPADNDASFYIRDHEVSEYIKVLSGNSTECHANPQLWSPLQVPGPRGGRDLDQSFDSPFRYCSMPRNFHNSYDSLYDHFITDGSPDSFLADDSFFNFNTKRKPQPPSRPSSVGSNSSQVSHPPPSRPKKRRRTIVNIDSEELRRGVQSWDDGHGNDILQGPLSWKAGKIQDSLAETTEDIVSSVSRKFGKKDPGQAKKLTSSIGSQDDSINTILNPAQYKQRLHKAESMYFECRTRLISELERVTPDDASMHSAICATFQELHTLGINYRHVESNQLDIACLKKSPRRELSSDVLT